MMVNNIGEHVPVQFAYNPTPINTDIGIIYAAIVLLGLYIMIIWEVRSPSAINLYNILLAITY